MLRLISIVLLFSQIILSQGITVNRKHYFDNLGGTPVAGNYIPDIVYSDSSVTAGSTAYDTLGFNHWGSIAANQLIMLLIVCESNSGVTMWGGDDDTVSQAGWTLELANGSGTAGQYLGIFWKRATGSESGHFFVRSNVAGEQVGWYLVLDSVETTGDPIDGTGTFTNHTTAANQSTISAYTTSANNTLALGFMGIDAGDSLYVTAVTNLDGASTGWVEHDRSANRVNAFTSAGFITRKKIYTAGTTGSVIINHRYESASSVIIAIKGDN